MKIALIGYGAMGKLIRTLAEEKGHEIGVVIDDADAGLSAAEFADKLKGIDVAIDFTTAEAVRRNVEACVLAGVPLVEGTTGWNASRGEIEQLVRDGSGAMVFGANFSIGVNLFYRIAEFCCRAFCQVSRIRGVYRRAASFAQERCSERDGVEAKGRGFKACAGWRYFRNASRKHSGHASCRV